MHVEGLMLNLFSAFRVMMLHALNGLWRMVGHEVACTVEHDSGLWKARQCLDINLLSTCRSEFEVEI